VRKGSPAEVLARKSVRSCPALSPSPDREASGSGNGFKEVWPAELLWRLELLNQVIRKQASRTELVRARGWDATMLEKRSRLYQDHAPALSRAARATLGRRKAADAVERTGSGGSIEAGGSITSTRAVHTARRRPRSVPRPAGVLSRACGGVPGIRWRPGPRASWRRSPAQAPRRRPPRTRFPSSRTSTR